MTYNVFGGTLNPAQSNLFSTKSFHSLSLLIRSSSVSAITTRSSAYSNSQSHGKATLNSLDKASMTMIYIYISYICSLR